MRCIHCESLGGSIDESLYFSEEVPTPKRTEGSGELLIQVLACALAPGDLRVLSGQCDFYQAPKHMPYVPGGDLCGVVIETDEDETKFRFGDRVAVMFEPPGPHGALAEYAVVKREFCETVPASSVSSFAASTLTSSALTAMLAVDRHVKRGDRILVLGGSGGVGTFFVQLAKLAGADYVAATSTQKETLLELGVDRVIDYTKEDWWEVDEFQANPFDLIFDLVGGEESWEHAGKAVALKRKGTFLTTMGDNPYPEIHGPWGLAKYEAPLVWRTLWTKLWMPFVPSYKIHFGLDIKPGHLARLLKLVEDGLLRVVFDESSPFPFTAEGVRAAFHLQESRHAHGKVIVQVADDAVMERHS